MFRAVAADNAYGDQDGFRAKLAEVSLPFVMALKPRRRTCAYGNDAHTPVDAVCELRWGGPEDPGDWTAVRRTFRDGPCRDLVVCRRGWAGGARRRPAPSDGHRRPRHPPGQGHLVPGHQPAPAGRPARGRQPAPGRGPRGDRADLRLPALDRRLVRTSGTARTCSSATGTGRGERGPHAAGSPPVPSWPGAARGTRLAFPWIALQRWWQAWSKAPPPPPRCKPRLTRCRQAAACTSISQINKLPLVGSRRGKFK